MATVTATDFLVATGTPGLWVRLRNNVSGTDYYSTAVSDPQGSFTYSVPAGDYSLYTGTAATVLGTPNLRSPHYQVAVRNGDDAALGSATVLASSPYTPKALAGTVDTANGVFDWGGELYNVKSQNNPGGAAKGDGVTDDDAALNGAVTAIRAVNVSGQTGGTMLLPPGIFLTKTTKNFNVFGMRILGAGPASILRVNGAMANGMINISANQCVVESLLMDGSSQTATSNPAADGIVISGGPVCTRILSVSQFYLNGWGINFLSTCTGYQVYIDNYYSRQMLNGVSFDGTAAPANSVGAMITNAFPDTVITGDAWFFQNAHDVVMGTTFGSIGAASTGYPLHLKGLDAGIQITGSDFYSQALAGRYCCLIEANGANIPKDITVGTTIFANGDFAVVQTNGAGVSFYGCVFALNRQGSYYITGSAGDSVSLSNCVSKENNVGLVGGTAEISYQNINVKAQIANHTFLAGTNAIPILSLVAGNNQLRISGSQGYNPAAGGVTTPGFPATTVAVTNNTATDVMAYITNGAGALTVQVGAVASLMIIPASQVAMVYIPASTSFTPTYAAGAPTWKWYGL